MAGRRKRAKEGSFLKICFDKCFLILFFLWISACAVKFFSLPSQAQQPETIQETVYRIAPEYHIDPVLVLAVIEVESQFKVNAVGKSHGEIGLMQLHPRYFPTATFDVEKNIRLGIEHLSQVKRMKRSVGCAWFVYYNTGVNGKVRYPELHPYYRKVTEQYPEYCDKLKLAGI